THCGRTNGATGNVELGAPLLPNVEFAGFDQSTWNFHSRRSKPVSPADVGGIPVGSSTSATKFGAPAIVADPSRSPGSCPMYWPPGGLCCDSSKNTTRAGLPCSIWLRSKTNAPAPAEVTVSLG